MRCCALCFCLLLAAPAFAAEETSDAGGGDPATGDETLDQVPQGEEPKAAAEGQDPGTELGAPEDSAEAPQRALDPGASEFKEHAVLRLSVGVGNSRERETGSTTLLNVLASLDISLGKGIRLTPAFSDRVGRQTYLSVNPDPEVLGHQQVVVQEQVQDARLALSVNVLQKASKRLALRISLAPRYVHLANPSFAAWAGSLQVGLGFEVEPIRGLAFDASAAWSSRFFGSPSTLSVLGLPKTFWDFGFGTHILLGPGRRWSVDLGWRANSIVFEHTRRVQHAAVAGVSASF